MGDHEMSDEIDSALLIYVTSIEHGSALRQGVTIAGYFQPKRPESA